MKSAVIFDMDGTVIDSMGVYETVKYEVVEDMGITLSESELEVLSSVSHWEFPNVFNTLREEKLDESEFFHIVNTRVRNSYRIGFPLKKGVERFLDYMDEKGIKYCIATASKNINAISAFTHLDMMDRFEFIITTGDVDRSKRYPSVYKEAAIMLGSKISETFVFEDALYAVESAKRGGFKVVGIADKYFEKDRDKIIATADYFIEDYDDLMDQIEAKTIVFD
ncbi:MAG: HAD family phosphatase [Erysipelothrix sp.]|nr:HAD family phosphatase [Erysipelothrix sp.]